MNWCVYIYRYLKKPIAASIYIHLQRRDVTKTLLEDLIHRFPVLWLRTCPYELVPVYVYLKAGTWRQVCRVVAHHTFQKTSTGSASSLGSRRSPPGWQVSATICPLAVKGQIVALN